MIGKTLKQASDFGWDIKINKFNWKTLIKNVRTHINSLNYGYKTLLEEKGIPYINL